MPGARMIGDNVNALSEKTLGLILRCQPQLAFAEGRGRLRRGLRGQHCLKANAEHPTDSRLIRPLPERAAWVGTRLPRFGLPDFRLFQTG